MQLLLNFRNIKQRKRISMQKLVAAAAEGSIPGTSLLFKHPNLPLRNQHFISVHSLACTPNYYYYCFALFPFLLLTKPILPTKSHFYSSGYGLPSRKLTPVSVLAHYTHSLILYLLVVLLFNLRASLFCPF